MAPLSKTLIAAMLVSSSVAGPIVARSEGSSMEKRTFGKSIVATGAEEDCDENGVSGGLSNGIGGLLGGSKATTGSIGGSKGESSSDVTAPIKSMASDASKAVSATTKGGDLDGAISKIVSGSVTCPDNDGTTFTCPLGNVYKINCGADITGEDLEGGVSSKASFDDCMTLCGETSECLGAAFDSTTSDSNCHLKKSVSGTTTAPNGHMCGQLIPGQGTVGKTAGLSIPTPSLGLPVVSKGIAGGLPTPALPILSKDVSGALPTPDLPNLGLPSHGLPSLGLPSGGFGGSFPTPIIPIPSEGAGLPVVSKDVSGAIPTPNLPNLGLPSLGLPSLGLPSGGFGGSFPTPVIPIPSEGAGLPVVSKDVSGAIPTPNLPLGLPSLGLPSLGLPSGGFGGSFPTPVIPIPSEGAGLPVVSKDVSGAIPTPNLPLGLPSLGLPSLGLPSGGFGGSFPTPAMPIPSEVGGLPILSKDVSGAVPTPDLPNLGLPSHGLPSLGLPSGGFGGSFPSPSLNLPVFSKDVSGSIPTPDLPNLGLPSHGLPSLGLPSGGFGGSFPSPSLNLPIFSKDVSGSIPTPSLVLPSKEVSVPLPSGTIAQPSGIATPAHPAHPSGTLPAKSGQTCEEGDENCEEDCEEGEEDCSDSECEGEECDAAGYPAPSLPSGAVKTPVFSVSFFPTPTPIISGASPVGSAAVSKEIKPSLSFVLPSGAPSADVSKHIVPTTIATSYVDLHPTGGLTTIHTTMTTEVCPEDCGENGAPSSITLTKPALAISTPISVGFSPTVIGGAKPSITGSENIPKPSISLPSLAFGSGNIPTPSVQPSIIGGGAPPKPTLSGCLDAECNGIAYPTKPVISGGAPLPSLAVSPSVQPSIIGGNGAPYPTPSLVGGGNAPLPSVQPSIIGGGAAPQPSGCVGPDCNIVSKPAVQPSIIGSGAAPQPSAPAYTAPQGGAAPSPVAPVNNVPNTGAGSSPAPVAPVASPQGQAPSYAAPDNKAPASAVAGGAAPVISGSPAPEYLTTRTTVTGTKTQIIVATVTPNVVLQTVEVKPMPATASNVAGGVVVPAVSAPAVAGGASAPAYAAPPAVAGVNSAVAGLSALPSSSIAPIVAPVYASPAPSVKSAVAGLSALPSASGVAAPVYASPVPSVQSAVAGLAGYPSAVSTPKPSVVSNVAGLASTPKSTPLQFTGAAMKVGVSGAGAVVAVVAAYFLL